MRSHEFTVITINGEEVNFNISDIHIFPPSNFRTACRWYSLDMLTPESKDIMDEILDEFVIARGYCVG
jgi:hypothetical protein